MARPRKNPQPDPTVQNITGVAYTMEAAKDAGFSNFRIVTLFLIGGEIVHVEKSQPFATFEALARAEILMSDSIWNLSSRYKDGAVQSMGGNSRDELVNRLKKTNPELLYRIGPAIGISRPPLETQ